MTDPQPPKIYHLIELDMMHKDPQVLLQTAEKVLVVLRECGVKYDLGKTFAVREEEPKPVSIYAGVGE